MSNLSNRSGSSFFWDMLGIIVLVSFLFAILETERTIEFLAEIKVSFDEKVEELRDEQN